MNSSVKQISLTTPQIVVTVYALAPLCARCRKAWLLAEQACAAEGVTLVRKSLWVSLVYMLVTFQSPPAILINGRLVSQGRVPKLEELRQWIRETE